MRQFLNLIIVALSFASGLSAAGADGYKLYEADTLGRFGCLALASNSRGEFAGFVYGNPPGFTAFFYSQGVTFDVGASFAGNSEVFALNDRGLATGIYYSGNVQRGFVWDQTTGATDIGSLGGYTLPLSINFDGDITGESASHAFVWRKGTMIDLGNLGGFQSRGVKINNRRQVLGSSFQYTGDRAFFWDPKRGATMLPDLGGGSTWPIDLNDRGWAIGASAIPDDDPDDYFYPFHAFVYHGGIMVDISPPNAIAIEALDINERNQVVGWYFDQNFTRRAFYWDPTGGPRDIHPTGYAGSRASAINNAGVIAGNVYTPFNAIYPFVLKWGRVTVIGEQYTDRAFTEVYGPVQHGGVIGLTAGDGVISNYILLINGAPDRGFIALR